MIEKLDIVLVPAGSQPGLSVTEREGEPLLDVPLSPSLTELRRGICVVVKSRGDSCSILDTGQPGTDCTSS